MVKATLHTQTVKQPRDMLRPLQCKLSPRCNLPPPGGEQSNLGSAAARRGTSRHHAAPTPTGATSTPAPATTTASAATASAATVTTGGGLHVGGSLPKPVGAGPYARLGWGVGPGTGPYGPPGWGASAFMNGASNDTLAMEDAIGTAEGQS